MAKYMLINTESKDIEKIKQEIQKAFNALGTKIVIKRAKDGYNENGNFDLEKKNLNYISLPDWIIDGSKIFVEEFLDIQAEFALQIIK
jgi:phosphoribosylaminoimidazole carboxylase (NCAIR synthetase)